MSILKLSDRPAQPWKNGLGRTRELAVHPSGASMDGFLWRISIAEVDKAAPFSAFPGVDRVIALLDGDGFVMHMSDGRTHALTTPCAPFAFAGELDVAIALAGKPGRDFNLMLRRGCAHGGIDVWRGPGTHGVDADVALVFCAHGRIDCDEGTLAADEAWLPRGGNLTLHADAIALVVRVANA